MNTCEPAALPLLPGATSISKVIRLYDPSYSIQKFFPAKVSGGVSVFKAIGAPFPQKKFCPTGGITLNNTKDYLSLGNTICIGDSWGVPKELIKAKDWFSVKM